MLTPQQQTFCKNIALYEMTPYEAFKNAGYAGEPSKVKGKIRMLMCNPIISGEIDRLRKKYLDIDEVRRDIILEHNKTRELDITSVCYPVQYYDDFGNIQTRLEVKPIADWSPELRRACTGFDKNGVPQFRSKDGATKELSRIFGLYKDNQIIVTQDLDGIYADATGEKEDIDDVVINEYEGIDDEETLLELDEQLNTITDEELGLQEDEDYVPSEEEIDGVDEDKIEPARLEDLL